MFPRLNKLQHINDKALLITFIVLACWFLNYLSIGGYGLYYDDWPAIADFTKLKLWNGVDSPFGWFEIWPHGRPVGWFFLSLLGWPGRQSGELVDLYLVGFSIVSAIGVLIYLIIDRKFGRTAGLLSALLFISSPVDTTRLELTLNYISHTGLLFSLLSIWLYQHNKTIVAYAVSTLALLSYESTFFIFAAAPLLTLELHSLNTWKKLVQHIVICISLVISVSAVRYWIFNSGFSIHENQQHRHVVESFFLGLKIYTFHFFDFFLFGIKQGFKHLTVLSAAIGVFIYFPLAYFVYRSKAYSNGFELRTIIELFVVGLALLMLGLITSGFADYYPGLPYGGRNTRVFVAASFGGGAIISSLMLLVFMLSKKYRAMPIAFLLMFILILGVTSNALKIQDDYVEAWDIQKQVFRSAIDLSCDATPGDTIILVPQEPVWDKGRAIHPYGFGYSTAIADTFDWGNMDFRRIPSLMKAHKDWQEHLEIRNDGKLHWTKIKLSGFPVLASAPVEPESIIFLKGTKRGLIRVNEPVLIDGVNVLKRMPQHKSIDDCIFRKQGLTGPLAPFLYPDLFAFKP